MIRLTMTIISAAAIVVAGCETFQPISVGNSNPVQLRERALEGLKNGVRYDAIPLIRMNAIEAFEKTAPSDGLSWIRTALSDPDPGVRFAACVALGNLNDQSSKGALQQAKEDTNDNVRIAAAYALAKLGDKSHGQTIGQVLLAHNSPAVRANAAMLLGMLGDAGAISVLNQARFDKDENVVDMVVESKARLGDAEAVEQLIFAANSDMGPQEVTAINTLRELKNPRFKGLFEHKLKNASFLETKLAAARALGELGNDDGYNVAMKALRSPKAGKLGKQETRQIQQSRITGMAVHALGAIGDRRALGALESTMEKRGDVATQLAAAKAILEIVNKPGAATGTMYSTAGAN